MELEDMVYINGGVFCTIDFPAELTTPGKSYFIDSLKSQKKQLEYGLKIKFAGLSNEQIETEVAQEKEYIFQNRIYHDSHVGPLSINIARQELRYIDNALEYVETHPNFTDQDLYNHLIKDRKSLTPFTSEELEDIKKQILKTYDEQEDGIEYSDPEEYEDDEPVEEEEFFIAKKDDNFLDVQTSEKALSIIFSFYRTSQFDQLNATEKALFVFELKNNFIPFYIGGYTFHQSAINDSTKENEVEKYSEVYEGNLEYIFERQMKTFLFFNHNYMTRLKEENNANSYLAFQRVKHSFEVLQTQLHARFFKDITYSELLWEMNEGLYTVGFSLDKYNEYYKSKPETRIALADPTDFGEPGDGILYHENFSGEVYSKEMNLEQRTEFDKVFQSKLDIFAGEIGMPSAKVKEFRELDKLNQRPRIL